jgi:branched-chain amino acid aminotransferase
MVYVQQTRMNTGFPPPEFNEGSPEPDEGRFILSRTKDKQYQPKSIYTKPPTPMGTLIFFRPLRQAQGVPYLHPMSLFINFNGKLLPEDDKIIRANNRGLRYGDGLFETMKLQNGEIRLFDLHMERLFKGLALLKFDIPALFTKEFLRESILQLSHKNRMEQLARVRLNVFRGAGGLYDPEDLHPNYVIEIMPLPDHYLHLNENGLVVDIYPDARKTCDILSNSKTNNYLPYLMAALHAKQNKLNDCFVLNQHDRICDATIANIFWIKDSVIFTPLYRRDVLQA